MKNWLAGLLKGRRSNDLYAPCDHSWQVVSTVLSEGFLQTQCRLCGLYGSVLNPSEEEWSKAFEASSSPYDWLEPERVETPFATIGEWLDAARGSNQQ
ncbi:hypothetical protein [Tateyamaria sp.]|uniref:hypothetical protein n=1 Tax=Tateyamaria sp. TaxID=1929288 RepID=UPI00329B49C5